MKKIFLVFLFLIIVISLVCYFKLSGKIIDKHNTIEKEDITSKDKSLTEDTSMPINTNNYEKSDTITLDEYLYADKDKGVLKINKNGDAIFNNKVIITNRNTPINNKTAYTDLELIILFHAQGAKPKPGCDPKDTVKNGTIGCYIDDPDKD